MSFKLEYCVLNITLQIANAVGEYRPASLQRVDSLLWTKLIEVASGKTTPMKMLRNFLTELPHDATQYSSKVDVEDAHYFFPGNYTSCCCDYFSFFIHGRA